MPAQPEPTRVKGISLPPSGWTLAVLLALYICTGLVGHDPWRNDDAVTIGLVHDIVANGNWLTATLAGNTYPDAPLYYWLAAASAHLFSWLLPVHEAARLASGLFTLLALTFMLLAARELHGRDQAPAAPLLLAGSIGFLFHAHEAQPMLASLTAHAAAYWGLTQLNRRPLRGAVWFGSALGLGILANDLAPMMPLLPVAVFVVWRSEQRQRAALLLVGALLLASVLVGLWLAAVFLTAPDYLRALWQGELTQLAGGAQPVISMQRLLLMLLWYAWPALPLAGWAIWAKRHQLGTTPLALPIFAFVVTLVLVSSLLGARSAPALLLLPPLVLLAVPGVSTLRRGAANAFDWFAMITFSVFALLAWIGWYAIEFGWPERLARQAIRHAPGFIGHFSIVGASFALLGTLIWCWLIATSPRSPMRGTMHWMSGLTLFWLLIATLWMPWIDYGKTYRQLSASLAKSLPAEHECIASANVPESILASLDYFDGIRTISARYASSEACNLLLIHGSPKDAGVSATSGWRKIWVGGRPGERRDTEKLHLFAREEKRASPPHK